MKSPVTIDQPKGRSYGGKSSEERREERRERLLSAAVDVYAEHGRERASVALICQQAGLTARYFYESFENSEALFIAAYQRVVDELLGEMRACAADARTAVAGASAGDPPRAALRRFFEMLREHPSIARFFLLDLAHVDSEAQAVAQAGFNAVEALLLPAGLENGGVHALVSAGVSGAVLQIARRWISLDYADDIDAVIAAAELFLGVTVAR